jgi:multiple sugar transport system substrate-binding protein
MPGMTRRSLINRSIGLFAAAGTGALARPYIANAQAKTATMWFAQGFVPDEDDALRKTVADYEKQSGNHIDLSIIPFAPLRQKTVSAITSGEVPDLIENSALQLNALMAWDDKLQDVSDVVDAQKSKYHPNCLAAADLYDRTSKQRSFYGVPHKAGVIPFHVWGDLVEKAGYKTSDIPHSWDAFLDFFRPVQDKLRAQGLRHVYGLGLEISTIGDDPTNTFHQWLIAYGGVGLVTKDGKLHADDPQVKEAAIKALTQLSKSFKDGYVPPESVNWNDADDNNAFHSKLIVMDFDGTLSTELAMIKDKQAYYHDMLTLALPLTDAGKQMPAQLGAGTLMIPKGAANTAVAKDFARYIIQPEILNAYLKGGLGRWLPPMPSIALDDPWWTDPKRDPHVPIYVKEGLVDPTVPYYFSYNPAYAEVMAQHNWNIAWADIARGGMAPDQAVDKALKQIELIFAKYPIAAS